MVSPIRRGQKKKKQPPPLFLFDLKELTKIVQFNKSGKSIHKHIMFMIYLNLLIFIPNKNKEDQNLRKVMKYKWKILHIKYSYNTHLVSFI